MLGIQSMLAFTDTVRYGGFTAASRETGLSPSALAKSVARLEESLGLKLFHRTTRQVRLTPDGERLYERCQRVLAELEDLQAEASSARGDPAGMLRMDLPVYYGKHVVLPVLAALQARHPRLELDLRYSDVFTDLVRNRIDLAVRIGTLDDSTLIARQIGEQHLVLCASREYLELSGQPDTLEALAEHRAIVFRLPTTGRDRPWQFRQRGRPVEYRPKSRVRINDTEALLHALLLGMGICQVPDYLVAAALAEGRLVELLPSLRPKPLPINIVYPAGRLLPGRVRVAIEALDSLRSRR